MAAQYPKDGKIKYAYLHASLNPRTCSGSLGIHLCLCDLWWTDRGELEAARFTHGGNPEMKRHNTGTRNAFAAERAPFAQGRGWREKVHRVQMQMCARECQEGPPRGKQGNSPPEHAPPYSSLFQAKSNGLQNRAGRQSGASCGVWGVKLFRGQALA